MRTHGRSEGRFAGICRRGLHLLKLLRCEVTHVSHGDSVMAFGSQTSELAFADNERASSVSWFQSGYFQAGRKRPLWRRLP